MFRQIITECLAGVGLPIGEDQLDRLEGFCDRLLEKNRVMVIAGTAAVLFALSLIFFPTEKESLSAPEGFVPCGEGEPASASC